MYRKYTSEQIQFIVEQKSNNESYAQIAKIFTKKFGDKITPEGVRSVWRRHKGGGYQGKKQSVFTEDQANERKAKIIEAYKKVLTRNKQVPNWLQLKNEAGISRHQLKYHFGSLTGLEKLIRNECPELFDGIQSERESILRDFLTKVEGDKHVPTKKEFSKETGVSGSKINNHFGSFEELENLARAEHPEYFEEIIDESLFTEEMFHLLKDKIAKHKRFVITTAVTGCLPHEKGMKSIQNYCKRNKAMLLILPCSDPASTRACKYKMSLNYKIPNDAVVFRDLELNSNLIVSTIKLSAKQINPLTGLRRLGHKGSCILASPKQMLEHVASSNKKGIPRAIMTTGAITVPDYTTEMYMSERTAYIANEDHKLGAVIVEIKDDKTFFYRRVEINPNNGSFCDLNKKYLSSGKVEKVSCKVLNQADWHNLATDPNYRKAAKEITKLMKPDFMTLEDFFDGASINPHEKGKVVVRAKKFQEGRGLLSEELKLCSKEIDSLMRWGAKHLVFKYGNHEDFLKRWLDKAEYATDEKNHYEGICLAKAMFQGDAPFEHAMRHRYPVSSKYQNRMTFLGVNDSFKVDGIENGVHGHLGASGKRSPTVAGLEAYGPCTVGHTHSAAILREVVRVGTATKLQLEYNDGASAWTHTLCIQHRDGARQLITIVDGEWKL